MASLEPAIRKVLHRIENLVLNVPETTHIVLKRGGIRNHHTSYGFQLLCRIVHPVPPSLSSDKKARRSKPHLRTDPEPMPHSRMNTCPGPHGRQEQSSGAIARGGIVNCSCRWISQTRTARVENLCSLSSIVRQTVSRSFAGPSWRYTL